MISYDPVILSAVRTPSGKFQGSLSSFTANQLGSIVIKSVIERSGLNKLDDISEVIMGNYFLILLIHNPLILQIIGLSFHH